MDDRPGTATPQAKRAHRWSERLLWAAGVLAFLCALVLSWHSVTFPSAIAKHPVRADGTVTASVISGLGGDPAVEYRYTVAGRTYKGEGNGELGHQRPEFMRPGDAVAIEYAADAPSESCTCNSASKQPPSTAMTALLAVLLSLPLGVLVTRRRLAQRAHPA